MAQSYLRNPSVERLPVILEELYIGSLRIPPFQRDFEWTGEQRIALCSSVRMGLPTGSLMVWRTSHQLEAENPIGPFELSVPRTTTAPQYLLDGRQRMTTLFAALAPAFWTREGNDPPAAHSAFAPDSTPWTILFDLEKEDFVLEPEARQNDDRRLSLFTPADTDKRNLLPLAVLLDDNAYDEWRLSTTTLSREHTNRARSLRSAFNDYLIPVVPLVTDDISVVTLTFKRVNSGGTTMGDADMTRALAWSKGFDLRDHIKKIREVLSPHGWVNLEDDAFLKVVAVVARLEPTEVDPEVLAKKIQMSPSLVQTAGERILAAVGLLRDGVGIVGPGALPYTQVLVFVARALDHAGGTLTQSQEATLTAWAAEICLDARFGAAPPHMVRAEWRALANRIGLPDTDPPRARDEKRPKAKECWVFSMAWARSRGTALVLADQAPRSGTGEPMENPQALVEQGSQNLGMLLADGADGLPYPMRARIAADRRLRVALRSPANRVVCAPRDLPSLRVALLNIDCPESIRESHLIDVDAHTRLVAGDLEGFFESRRRAILAAEQRWVRARGGEVEFARDERTYAEG